jgi:hypothetical protein
VKRGKYRAYVFLNSFVWVRNKGSSNGPEINGNVLKNGCEDSDYILVVYGDCHHK